MEPVLSNAQTRVVGQHHFDGVDVVTIELDGRMAIPAGHVSTALEYSAVDHVAKKISSDWSEELDEGTDYAVLRGETLAMVKEVTPDLVHKRAPSLMVLFESGIHLVALLSRQPKARKLRRWLAEEVLPSIRRTGSYQAPAAAVLRDQDIARVVGAVLEHLGRPLALTDDEDDDELDLDRVTTDVQRAREMRLLATRHRRIGRRLVAQRLEARAATLLLGEPPEEVPPKQDVALQALRQLVQLATEHRATRFYAKGGARRSSAGEWWGRWDRGAAELALRSTWVTATLEAAGHPAQEIRQTWAERGWLSVPSARGLTRHVRLADDSARCLVFPVDVLERLEVL